MDGIEWFSRGLPPKSSFEPGIWSNLFMCSTIASVVNCIDKKENQDHDFWTIDLKEVLLSVQSTKFNSMIKKSCVSKWIYNKKA